MKYRTVLGVCWTLAILAASAVLLPRSVAAADEPLYPHAEREFGPWGYIDKSGKTVIPLQFDWAEPFFEGRGAVMLDKRYGYVDNTGRLAVPMRFEGFSKYDPPPSLRDAARRGVQAVRRRYKG